MRDVAAVAGVSLSTVSRVIREDSSVADELAVRVGDAIRVTGYRRDLTASSLRRTDGHSASIGLIIEDVANPFLAALYRGVEEVVRGRGVMTIASSSDGDAGREQALAEALLDRRVDALLISPASGDHTYLMRDREAGVALVFIDRPPSNVEADKVVSDNRGGARAAVEHLLARGHRRIAVLTDRLDIFTAAERLEGYREALADAGIAGDDRLRLVGLRTSAEGERAVTDLFRSADPPTAVFTAQNEIGLGALRALGRLGLRRSVAHVNFDDLELADLLEPGLTVIAQDPVELGRAGARLVFARLESPAAPYRRVVLPTRLIARGSGEIPAPTSP